MMSVADTRLLAARLAGECAAKVGDDQYEGRWHPFKLDGLGA
jgi:hypothetical protein